MSEEILTSSTSAVPEDGPHLFNMLSLCKINAKSICEYPKFSKHLILENKGEILEERTIPGLLIIPVSMLLRKKKFGTIFLLTRLDLTRSQKNKSISE